MEIQQKPDYLIFAEGSKSGELSDFPDILRGWGITLEQTQAKPPLEWMNSAFNRIDKNTLYLLQQGVPEWSESVLYPIGAIIKVDGTLYEAKTQNTNLNPVNSSNDWQLVVRFQDATTKQKGVVQLSSVTNSASTTQAATPSAVKSAYDLATSALPKSGGTVTGKTNFTVTPTIDNADILKKGDGGLYSSAPLLASGKDLLTDDVLSVSQTFSLSGNYLNSPDDTSSITGTLIVTRRYYDTGAAATLEINQSENVFYKSTAYKSNGSWITYGWVKDITSGNISSSLPAGTTSAKGIVQLSAATNSTSTTLAATPSAVKSAYDLASNAMPNGTGGIGLATQTATNGINIDTYAFNVGFYSGSNWSSTKGLPFGKTATDVWFYLINQNLASAGSDYKLQILGLNETGAPRLAMRYKVKGSWTDWAEFASKTDIEDLGNNFQVIYPNGSESNPPTLTNNQRVVIENPFKTSNCYAVTELYLKNEVSGNMEWFTYSNMNKDSATYGLLTNVSDSQIIVQTATSALISATPSFDGNPWSSTSAIKSAPFRVRVIKLGN